MADLPADVINRALGLELDAAPVWMSKAAHRHIALDHPDDYPRIIDRLGEVISRPAYVGQKPGISDNFYVVRNLRDVSSPILVAVGIELSTFGSYNLRSAYCISKEDVDRYRQSGHLFIVK
ncbi:MAG: hypothetical protein GC187_03435 [Alphaproteobacteria bacterium]|nr:hypothetical protein [Alphaproteobacteria bacterium]